MPDPLTVGKLAHALRWSPFGIAVGFGWLVALIVADVAAWAVAEEEVVVVHFHSLMLALAVALLLCSVVVYVAARLMVYQRGTRLALVEELRAARAQAPHAPRPRKRRRSEPADVVSLPSAETVAAVRRLAARVAGPQG